MLNFWKVWVAPVTPLYIKFPPLCRLYVGIGLAMATRAQATAWVLYADMHHILIPAAATIPLFHALCMVITRGVASQNKLRRLSGVKLLKLPSKSWRFLISPLIQATFSVFFWSWPFYFISPPSCAGSSPINRVHNYTPGDNTINSQAWVKGKILNHEFISDFRGVNFWKWLVGTPMLNLWIWTPVSLCNTMGPMLKFKIIGVSQHPQKYTNWQMSDLWGLFGYKIIWNNIPWRMRSTHLRPTGQ